MAKSGFVGLRLGCLHLNEWTGKSRRQQHCRLCDAVKGCAGVDADTKYRKSAERLVCNQNRVCVLVTPRSKVACDIT